jgi:hypothetical protein
LFSFGTSAIVAVAVVTVDIIIIVVVVFISADIDHCFFTTLTLSMPTYLYRLSMTYFGYVRLLPVSGFAVKAIWD